MTWSMKNQCSHKPKVCGIQQKFCKLPYMVCMQSIFPTTPTMFIKYKDKHAKKRFYTDVLMVNVDPSTTPKNIGTQMTGQGDSGTGHWIVNTESEPSRAVLVAITTRGKVAMASQVQITTHETILNFIKTTLDEFESLFEDGLESH